jgi:hypothetical protein
MSDAAETPPEPAPKKFDRRKISGPENGKRAGQVPGKWRKDKHLLPKADIERAVEIAAASIAEKGTLPRRSPQLQSLSEEERLRFGRFVGVSADEFQERLGLKLRAMADKVADRIFEKLEEDKFKPEGLSFLLTVVVDKLRAVEGRASLLSSTVNIQVNNFEKPKDKLEVLERMGLVKRNETQAQLRLQTPRHLFRNRALSPRRRNSRRMSLRLRLVQLAKPRVFPHSGPVAA